MLFKYCQVRSTILFFLFLTSLLPLAGAQTIVDVGETTPPQNMILLIFDGMGSSYVCLDGNPNIQFTGFNTGYEVHKLIPFALKVSDNGTVIIESDNGTVFVSGVYTGK